MIGCEMLEPRLVDSHQCLSNNTLNKYEVKNKPSQLENLPSQLSDGMGYAKWQKSERGICMGCDIIANKCCCFIQSMAFISNIFQRKFCNGSLASWQALYRPVLW